VHNYRSGPLATYEKVSLFRFPLFFFPPSLTKFPFRQSDLLHTSPCPFRPAFFKVCLQSAGCHVHTPACTASAGISVRFYPIKGFHFAPLPLSVFPLLCTFLLLMSDPQTYWTAPLGLRLDRLPSSPPTAPS